MKKINIEHPRNARAVSLAFTFFHPADDLSDFEKVEIIPLDSDGKQICKSEIRTVVRVGHPDERGIAAFDASVHLRTNSEG